MEIQHELHKFFNSDEGQQIIGQVVMNAVNQALTREIHFEDGKGDPGRVVEKIETWNILDWLVKYMPHVEAAVRGCQADSAKARNRAAETGYILSELTGIMQRAALQQMNRKVEMVTEK